MKGYIPCMREREREERERERERELKRVNVIAEKVCTLNII